MIDEQKLMWARLQETCGDYICEIIEQAMKDRFVAVRMGRLPSYKMTGAPDLIINLIPKLLNTFTIKEMKDAIEKLASKKFYLPRNRLLDIDEDLVGPVQIGQYIILPSRQRGIMATHKLHPPIPIVTGIKPIPKQKKGFSQKYYEIYR